MLAIAGHFPCSCSRPQLEQLEMSLCLEIFGLPVPALLARDTVLFVVRFLCECESSFNTSPLMNFTCAGESSNCCHISTAVLSVISYP